MSETEKTQAMASRSQRRKYGKTLRKQVPHTSHGDWQPAADRPNPLDLLGAQDEGRLQRLLPIKIWPDAGLTLRFSARLGSGDGR